jgi:hypothetical protein
MDGKARGTGVGWGGRNHGREGRRCGNTTRSWGWIAAAVLLLSQLLPLPGPSGRADALAWPRRSGSAAEAPTVSAPGVAGAERLQEVPPPAAVQQLAEALAERQPRLRILAPAADAVLPAGPFTLRLQVEDWPLVDGGSLGLGPHLLVSLDDGEPLAVTDTEVTLPELSPGSHRLTVMAARPWGEAVKSPGASAQIRLHRTAANPLSQPAEGTPQLLAVSPKAAAAEPLLLDWLLIDTPLQHLREADAGWRLRVTVNGDSFLVDRQTPLWLRGWRTGSNALLLELLDGRGEPLNPPFNSLVREVRLDPSLPRPAWSGARLAEADLAVLLGEAPPQPPEPEAAPEAEAAPGEIGASAEPLPQQSQEEEAEEEGGEMEEGEKEQEEPAGEPEPAPPAARAEEDEGIGMDGESGSLRDPPPPAATADPVAPQTR